MSAYIKDQFTLLIGEKRGELLLIYDILKVLPAITTHIARSVVLNTPQYRKYLGYMIRTELITLRGNQYFRTEKGNRIMKRLHDLLMDLGDLLD